MSNDRYWGKDMSTSAIIDNMSEQDLAKLVRAGNARLAEFEASKIRDKKRKWVHKCNTLRTILTPDVIDALAPDHSFRYKECTDVTLSGYARRMHVPKEYECLRCDLLHYTQSPIEECGDLQITIIPNLA